MEINSGLLKNGLAFMKNGLFDRAIDIFTSEPERLSTDSELRFHLVLSLLAAGRPGAAGKHLNDLLLAVKTRISAGDTDERLVLLEGILFHLLDRHREALVSLHSLKNEELIKEAAPVIEASLAKILSSHFSPEESDMSTVSAEAIVWRWFNGGAELPSFKADSIPPSGRGALELVKVFSALSRHDWEGASQAAGELRKKGWHSLAARIEAYCAFETGNYSRAIEKLEQAMNEENLSAELKLDMALYQMKRGDLVTAESLLNEIADSEAASPFFHELSGHLLVKKGLITDAFRAFEQVLKLDPYCWRAAFNGARLLLAELKFQECLEFIDKNSLALKDAPDYYCQEIQRMKMIALKLRGGRNSTQL